LLRPLVRLIWGDDLEPALRPLVAQALSSSLAASAGWSFVGIWAIKRLHAGQTGLGFAFLVGAVLGAGAGYLGGHLSDHIGRKPMMLVGSAGFTLLTLGFTAVGQNRLPGLALISCAAVLGGLAGSSGQALIADLVPHGRHEAAYATMRVASNLGTTLGPAVGGALLALGGWNVLFFGVASMMGVAFVVSALLIPSRGEFAAEGPPERSSLSVIRGDRTFLLFLVSGALAYLVYISFETVLPISLVDAHGLRPATWGFLVVINPLMVTLLQLRLTRKVAHVPPATKIVVAMGLMGFPFLLLSVSAAIPLIVLMLFVFVIGEMLWAPTSQAVVASLAPVDIRGAYMGAFASTSSFGFAVGPLLGLQLRSAFGDTAMWLGFATVALLAAAAAAVALHGHPVRSTPVVSEAGSGFA
jgi:predicted MFS family arabinose efflux permease